MSLKSIYELYQAMERDHTMLSFKGVVTPELLSSVLQIMESKLNHVEKSSKTKKKVYNVLVECLQNLYHHNENIEGEEGINFLFSKSALLMISKNDDHYEVKTGNYILKDNTEDLKAKLDDINAMNKDELRELYKTVLNDGELSDKGTAGLGMIDIARKSGNKLEYNFLSVDKKYDFFCLSVKIN
ncbi:MAG: SiaB family protein kinase [Brumimicrobium sp.]|nr:SiaB family protein kinase [Brumimicrobium sp.]